MNCLNCRAKICQSASSCGAEKFDISSTMTAYHADENQTVIQAAAELVDDGRAGTLSRIEEIIEFSQTMGYRKIGLAYCWGMTALAVTVRNIFSASGLATIGVSCTVGGFSQKEVNEESLLPGASCNPLNQAAQLNAEGVDLAVVIGLCMGHDILFNREFKGDITTLIVKDRPNSHNPLAGIEHYVHRQKQNETGKQKKELEPVG
jgi:uncharacterized metal-binding protein